MTLIRKLRDDVVDSSKSLTDVLRKAIVLASLLANTELRAWAKNELDGYASNDVPDYRHVPAQIYGQFAGPFGRQISNYRVPIHALNLSPRMMDLFSEEIAFVNGVGSLEGMLSQPGDGTLHFSMLTELCMLLPPVVEDYQCVALSRQTHKSMIMQVLDSIRSRLLDIVLDLAAQFPDINESEDAVKSVDRSAAASIIHNHIYGNSNVVGSGANFTQNVHQGFEPGDMEALMHVVADAGVSGKQQEDLRLAINQDGKQKGGKFGPRVAAWFGSTTQKLLESGLTAAPALLTEAISRYYGWK